MTTSLERVLAKTLDVVERAAPGPPPNLVELVNAGLRQRRRRHLVAASAATAVALVTVAVVAILASTSPQGGVAIAPTGVAISPAPYPSNVVTGACTVRELPLPSSFRGQAQLVEANDVDPTGRYVAGFVSDGLASWAVLWVDGQPRVLGKDAGFAVAVNSAGVVVGQGGNSSWVYRGGQINPLPQLPGTNVAEPVAINSRGDIVGDSDIGGVIWPGDQPGQVQPVGAVKTIGGVSDDGLMVGVDSTNEAQLWNPDGTVHPLPPGFGYRPQMVAGPWVLGEADAVGSNVGPVGVRYALWNVTTGAIVRLAVDTTTTGFQANALSESGAVVGYFVGADHRSRPAIFRAGKVILLPLPEGHSDDVEVRAISADGRTIVGTARTQAPIWHC
jgi:uncharacterized membrane protein